MVSIIVPIYNSERYLHTCLESIQRQTFEEIEVIMVNNGSFDRSKEICLEFAQDKRFKYLESPHGIVTACKTGISRASGGLITFVDSDDYIESNMIEQMHHIQNMHDCDIVVVGYVKIEGGNNVIKKTYDQEILFGEKLHSVMKKYFCFDETGHRLFYSSKWGKLFKREIILRNLKYYDESVIEDEDMCLVYPTMLSAQKIGLIDGVLYNYVQRKDSVTHTFYVDCINNQISVMHNLLRSLRENNDFTCEDENNIIYNRMLCLIQKARFFSIENAIEFLEKLYKINIFKSIDLKKCDTTFAPKAKLAYAFLNKDFNKCLSLIDMCIIH